MHVKWLIVLLSYGMKGIMLFHNNAVLRDGSGDSMGPLGTAGPAGSPGNPGFPGRMGTPPVEGGPGEGAGYCKCPARRSRKAKRIRKITA
ncbi:hypothetical protein Aduo_018121 [Ancylostoma duodenale]